MKKLITLLLAIIVSFSVAGCGKKSDGSTTKLVIMNFGGGAGAQWIESAAARFKERVKDISFEEGKTGITFDFTHSTNTQTSLMKTSGYNMYFDESRINIRALSAAGHILDISDIIDEPIDTRNGEEVSILDKIEPTALYHLKGTDGKYYGLPHYEIYPGLSYDVDAFDRYGLYFAADTETLVTSYNCAMVNKTANFVRRNTSAKKSCGNDGVFGTSDDGLPTSLEELIILCDYMKKVHGITPFTFTGWHSDYSNILVEAIWINLAGFEQMRTNYTFNGEVEIVDGYEDTKLFSGIDYIKKPKTKKVDVTMDNGFEVSGMVAKYYALAFAEIAYKSDWFSKDSHSNTTSHVDAQGNFIWSGIGSNEKMGMLIEGNHWYKESQNYGNFKEYFDYTGETERKIAWMSMPTSFDQTVTENNGRENTMLDVNNSYAVINANIKNNTGLVKACKEFLKFLYTDAELEQFTEVSGLIKAKLNYSISETSYSKVSDFHQSIIDLKRSNSVLYQTADNDKCQTFYINFSADTVQPHFDVSYNAWFLAMDSNYTGLDIFEQLRMSSSRWTNAG